MDFSPQQDEALKAVGRWLKEGRPQVFRLFGYAGTGKTTLARHFAEHVDGQVQFAAFTGKAAQVLRSKGAVNARTIHSLIYRPKGEEPVEDEVTGKTSMSPTFSLNRQSPIARAKLVIIDECSMVDKQLGRDLLSFGTPILVLGDPGQLPPIKGDGAFTDADPDVMLTDIHRQAETSAIIRLATMARQGEPIGFGRYDDHVWKMRKLDVTPEQALRGGQVICGMNATRLQLNNAMRRAAGFGAGGWLPTGPGEKIICLKNRNDLGLVNGMFLDLTEVKDEDEISFTAVVTTAVTTVVTGVVTGDAQLHPRVRQPDRARSRGGRHQRGGDGGRGLGDAVALADRLPGRRADGGEVGGIQR